MTNDNQPSGRQPRWRRGRKPGTTILSLLALTSLVAAGCGGSAKAGSTTTGSAGGGGGGPKIALLLPENQTPRYEAHDRPDFEKKVKQLCSNCKVIYSNANGDATTQQSNADAALAQGAKVLVLDAVDAGSAGPFGAKAKAQNVAVPS